MATKLVDASNNLAEFKALEEALLDAVRNKLLIILIVTDSQLVFDLLIDANDICPSHLKAVVANIRSLLRGITTLYVSKVYSHRKDPVVGNQIADALCTWALNSEREHRLVINLSHHTLASRLQALNKSSLLLKPSRCEICLKEDDHTHSNCPIRGFLHSPNENAQPCRACLSNAHASQDCPLYTNPLYRPALAFSKQTTPLVPNSNLCDILDIDFKNLTLPGKQSGEQFDDFFETIFSTLFFADDMNRQQAAEEAILCWTKSYRIDGHAIRRIRRRSPPSATFDTANQNPNPADCTLHTRARKAAALGPDARVSDVTKALRASSPLELTAAIKTELRLLYPNPDDDETIFEPAPLPLFSISRHRVAKYIMSRSPRSHPGSLGLSFGILQLVCARWYKKETHDSPDPRWTLFCELIAKIMSGNATLMSPMLHTVFGFFFNKNFEKLGEPISIRNIGVEESLFRIPAALVFEQTIEDAIERGFITHFDLGAGKKAGAEIFAKIAEMASSAGAIITVMDVKKAFNNLRRKDIKAAVADFGNPLLTAFVHYMFERDPVIVFTDRTSNEIFTCTLKTGILQGNPLSVFIFALTIAYILRPLREKFAASNTIIPAFVDDMLFISNGKRSEQYPDMLSKFFATFKRHGLEFDFADDAKTSVFTTSPLPSHVQAKLQAIGIKCQSEGIAPCKCPFGTAAYMKKFVDRATTKLQNRFQAFKMLWPAMLHLDADRRRPLLRTHEQFLNLVRLSFLSMPVYTLRALNPSHCEPYSMAATNMANELIDLVFPLINHIPPSSMAAAFPPLDMLTLSRDIMQLPLSRGGLSLRLPRSVSTIAYVSSCIDCSESLLCAAAALNLAFKLNNFGEYAKAATWMTKNIPTITGATFIEAIDSHGLKSVQTPQQLFTSLLNDHEIQRIATALAPVPAYYFAFTARTDKKQDHSSWPFNPKVRYNFSLAPLHDSEFSRGIQLATLRPTFSNNGWCSSCNEPLDSVGLHLLKCPLTNYNGIHDSVKLALASRLRSLMSAQMAAISVLVEKPVSLFAGLSDPSKPEGVVRRADITVLLPGRTQQDIFITDVVSVFVRTPNGTDGFYTDLNRAEAEKKSIYRKYAIPAHHFFPLAFGRTNILSRESTRFCDTVSNYFPKTLRVADSLRATFSRAIVNGVSASLNSAVRRLQLADANQVAFSMIPPVPDPARQLSYSLRQLSKIHAPLSKLPLHALGARLVETITRPSSQETLSDSSQRSLCGGGSFS